MIFWVETWRWVKEIPHKLRYLSTKLHGSISQKSVIFLFIAMITSVIRRERWSWMVQFLRRESWCENILYEILEEKWKKRKKTTTTKTNESLVSCESKTRYLKSISQTNYTVLKFSVFYKTNGGSCSCICVCSLLIFEPVGHDHEISINILYALIMSAVYSWIPYNE